MNSKKKQLLELGLELEREDKSILFEQLPGELIPPQNSPSKSHEWIDEVF